MEVTEIVKLRRAVLTKLAQFAYAGNLPDHVYDILQIVREDTPRLRCCVHKERACLKQRINIALGQTPEMNIKEAANKALDNPVDVSHHVIEVLPEACSACPVNKYMITDVCRRCLTHRCMNGCPKKAISVYQGRAHIDYDMCIECGNCKRSCPYGAVVEIARPCENACMVNAIHMGKNNRKAEIDKTKCVECGACRNACPFGAIEERSSIVQLIQRIKKGENVYALLAPSFVGQFGMKVTPGQIVAACHKLGFKHVREVSVGADMTVLTEAEEFNEKVPRAQKLLTSSCCPAFVATVKRHAPDLANCISDAVSPMVARSKAVRHEEKGVITVFVGPCIAKKVEAREHPNEIDFAMTFEELKCMMDSQGINPAELQEDAFHARSSADGCNFPQEAGVSNAVSHYLKKQYNREIKSKYVCGLSNCLEALKDYQVGKLDIEYLEGMACDKGCLNGPSAISEPGITKILLKRFADTTEIAGAADNEFAKESAHVVDMERVYLRK